MKHVKMDKAENDRFSNVVVSQFIDKIIQYGQILEYLSFYRNCHLENIDNENYLYCYPHTSEEIHDYILTIPKEIVEKALSLHEQKEQLIKELLKEDING